MMERNTLNRILVFSIFIQVSISSKVPVYIWGKHSLENFPAVSALEDINGKTFKEKFLSPLLQQKQTLIVYIQNTLSLEDLSSQNEDGKKAFQNLKENVGKQSSLLLPSVDDPYIKLAQFDSVYKVKQIHLNESFIEDILPAAEKNDIVLLHLSDSKNLIDRNKILNQNDNMMKKVQDTLSKMKKPVTYLYTGYSPSWDTLIDEARITRHLLAVEQPPSFQGILLNFTECGILYTHNVTANIVKNYTEILFQGTVEVHEKLPCFNDSNSTIEFEITLDMEKLQPASLIMDFHFTSSGWILNKTELRITYEDINENFILEAMEINAPKGFSYSCWQTVLKLPGNHTIMGNITFHSLQVQPFTTEKDKFASSFDCVPYFTIPIWMGFLVVMLFTGILAFGIYMLFNIRTMDKFDDPKGKTISVPTAE